MRYQSYNSLNMVVDINLTPTASLVDIVRTWKAADSGAGELARSLPGRTWGTSSECVAGALLVHGLGAHSGWFEGFGRRLKIRRIYTVAYDQVGFGRRRQQVFTSYDQWLDDINTAFDFVRATIGEKPLYVMGNSMGAAVALRAVSNGDISPKGLVLMSPGLDGHPSSFTLPFRVRALWQAFSAPDTEINLPYTVDLVTRDQSVRQWIKNDAERRFSIPARMLLELLKLTSDLASRSRVIKCPVFMVNAGVDKIVSNTSANKLFNGLTCPKQSKTFPEAWHDLMFDPVIDELTSEVVSWIKETNKL
jgi:alpha-beta hydrolase superfamily lysophospholipase